MSAIEAQAWADAGALAKEADNWRANGQWQDAMTLYMGANCADSNNKYKVYSKNPSFARVPCHITMLRS